MHLCAIVQCSSLFRPNILQVIMLIAEKLVEALDAQTAYFEDLMEETWHCHAAHADSNIQEQMKSRQELWQSMRDA